MEIEGITLSEISLTKTSARFHLYGESKKQNKQTKSKQNHKYREQTGGYQRGGFRGMGEIAEGVEEV